MKKASTRRAGKSRDAAAARVVASRGAAANKALAARAGSARKPLASRAASASRPSNEPTAESLRELPDVVFEQYRVRRNPYATRIAREGRQIVHDAPLATSLRELPEANFRGARIARNPYATRAAEASVRWQYGRGRPARAHEVGETLVRSLRLPGAAWQALDREAKARHTTTHALLRELVAAFLERL